MTGGLEHARDAGGRPRVHDLRRVGISCGELIFGARVARGNDLGRRFAVGVGEVQGELGRSDEFRAGAVSVF